LSNRLFWSAAILLLLFHGLIQFTTARIESQTFDEGIHLVAGFSYWRMGEFRMNQEHPPLSKLLAAAPLLTTTARLPDMPDALKYADTLALYFPFLYKNTVHADTLLLLGRTATILCSLALGLAIALWTRASFSPLAGIGALFLYATDPNFLAHGHYITSDVPVSLFIFLAVLTWLRALETQRKRHYAVAAVMLGLAIATKFSALFLLPAHLVVAVIKRRLAPVRTVLVFAGALGLATMTYAPETLRWRTLPPLAERIQQTTPAGRATHHLAEALHLPAHPFLEGLWMLAEHNETGHWSYLNGEVHESGDWRYFPTAFAVKTPLAVLVLIAARVILSRPVIWMIYPALYFLLSTVSNLNIGLRHLLPMYPFLFVWIGSALDRRWFRLVFVLAAAIQVYELARIHPHYLSFFNSAVGGAPNGHRYLLDSNLDWGQDGKKLAAWMKQNKLEEMCVSYFGGADLEYYGVRHFPLLHAKTDAERAALRCVAAVSVNNLYDLYTPEGTHAWARRLKPFGRIGHSILLYDLRNSSPPK